MSDAPRRSGGRLPPERPALSIAPMRPEPPAGRAVEACIAIVGWVAVIAMLMTMMLVITVNRGAVQRALTGGALHDNPERSWREVDRASDIALNVGGGGTAIVMIVGAVGLGFFIADRRLGRILLSVAAGLLVILVVAFASSFEPIRAAAVEAGLRMPIVWGVYAAGAVGVVSSALTYRPAVTARLHD